MLYSLSDAAQQFPIETYPFMLLWPDSEGGQNIFMQAKTNYIIIWNENVTASRKIWGTRYLAWELYADIDAD